MDTDNGRLCVGDVTGDISISRGNDAIGEIVPPCLVFIYYRVHAGDVGCLQMCAIATHQTDIKKIFICFILSAPDSNLFEL